MAVQAGRQDASAIEEEACVLLHQCLVRGWMQELCCLCVKALCIVLCFILRCEITATDLQWERISVLLGALFIHPPQHLHMLIYTNIKVKNRFSDFVTCYICISSVCFLIICDCYLWKQPTIMNLTGPDYFHQSMVTSEGLLFIAGILSVHSNVQVSVTWH